MDDILDVLQLGCSVKLDRFQAVRLGSYIKKLQAENEALTKLISEKAMVHVSMNVAEIRAEAIESVITDNLFKLIKSYGSKNCAYMVQDHLTELAAKVRQGEQSGTWLRDENVNGGKRHGGE